MKVELDVKVVARVPEAVNADGYKGLEGHAEISVTTVDLDEWDCTLCVKKIEISLETMKRQLEDELRRVAAKKAGCDMTKWLPRDVAGE